MADNEHQRAAASIFLARHGERLDFVDRTWHVSAARPHDAPLTATGVAQARALGGALAARSVSHIFTSPFQRCIQTAVAVAAGLPEPPQLNVEPGLCEWLNEAWYADSQRGPLWLTFDQIVEQFPTVNARYRPVYPMQWNFVGYPELYHHMHQRCARTLSSIVETVHNAHLPNRQSNILLVAHGSSLRALHTELLPTVPPITIGYCALTECIPTPESAFPPRRYTLGSYHCDQSFLP